MPINKNQHQKFTYEAIPIMFHRESLDFVHFLTRDGRKFLKFWWDRSGLNLEESLLVSPDGLDFEISTYKDGRSIIIIKLPIPKNDREAYYLGLVSRPQKKSVFPWKNFARVFALSRAEYEEGSHNTILAELTRSARYVPMGKGPKPDRDDFFDTVKDILDRKL